jgi:hypothetical protein
MQLYAKTFRCPDIVSQEDAMIVMQTLQNSPGIERFDVDHVVHQVQVRTANQGGFKDVVGALRHAGYPPEEED